MVCHVLAEVTAWLALEATSPLWLHWFLHWLHWVLRLFIVSSHGPVPCPMVLFQYPMALSCVRGPVLCPMAPGPMRKAPCTGGKCHRPRGRALGPYTQIRRIARKTCREAGPKRMGPFGTGPSGLTLWARKGPTLWAQPKGPVGCRNRARRCAPAGETVAHSTRCCLTHGRRRQKPLRRHTGDIQSPSDGSRGHLAPPPAPPRRAQTRPRETSR